MRLLFDEMMYEHTSLRVGGPATVWCEVGSGDELDNAIRLADKLHLPIMALGDGTNVLVSDDGINGIVLRLWRPASEIWPDFDHHKPGGLIDVRVEASATGDDLVQYVVENRWQGLECLSGIPGTVGAAAVQNIGAYGQQISDTIVSVTAVDLAERRYRTISNADCRFGYRSSIFNLPGNRDRFIITEVALRLYPDGEPCRTHTEVKGEACVVASLADIRNAVLNIRRRKGMLAGMAASAGSFFKNPIVSSDTANALVDRLGADWYRSAVDGTRISAARLIELAGFRKGYTHGRVGISPHHSLALVNLGGATADDICDLARSIQKAVLDEFGALLEPEVRLVGFKQYPLLQ